MILYKDKHGRHLENTIKKARSNGWKIVTTNGVFDILHAGHIATFEQCKVEGAGIYPDSLVIVGLNSDVSAKRLKGNLRPLQPEMSRAKVLRAIKYIDLVVIFDEDTPCELLEIIKPDVHVKAGYKVDEIPEMDVIRKYGGLLVNLPVLEEHSTTAIVKKIAYYYCPMLDGCPIRHSPGEKPGRCEYDAASGEAITYTANIPNK
jgi:rfaE bifunctional protein nucleotidyltransferase chain/domain